MLQPDTSHLGWSHVLAEPAPLVVGFDLDMTLIDTRPGFAATLAVLAAETGVELDVEELSSRLGPPLDQLLAPHYPADELPGLVDRFRAHYPDHAIAPTEAFPGAHEALAAVRRHGGRSVVVTGKYRPNAALHLDAARPRRRRARSARSGGRARATALTRARRRRSTSATTSTTSRAPARPGSLSVSVLTGGCTERSCATRAPTWCCDDLTEFPALARRAPARSRGSRRSSERLRGAGVGAGRLQRRRRQRVPARRGGPRPRARPRRRGDGATPTRSPQAERDPALAFAEALGVRVLTPRTARDGARGLPRQRRRPLLLLQGRAARRARPARRGARLRRTSRPAPTPTTPSPASGPGIRAAAERGAVTPLRDAGLTKAQVRAASRAWGLPTWDKPAAACLSSRVAYGIEVSPVPAGPRRARRGRRPGRAGRGRGDVRDLRVRDLGDRARVEVDAGRVEAVRRWPRCSTRCARAGFEHGRGRPARLPLRRDERAAATGALPLTRRSRPPNRVTLGCSAA